MKNSKLFRALLLAGMLVASAAYSDGQVVSRIIIIKQAAPESAQVFGFATTGTGLSNFTLVDDGNDNDATPNNITFTIPLSPGGSGTFTVTETANGFYDLTNLSCSVTGTAGSTGTANIPLSRVNITLQYSDTVTCTFFNSVATAAAVSITGRTLAADGGPIYRSRVTVTDAATGASVSSLTNPFGYFRIQGLAAGNSYLVTVSHKSYVFDDNPRVITLNDSVDNLVFIGN